MPPIALRPLDEATWPRAMRLCARAFADYGYAHATFGEDALERLAGTTVEFGSRPWDPGDLTVSAWIGGTLIGMARAAPIGHCHVCDPRSEPEPEESLVDERFAEALRRSSEANRRFDESRRRAHAPVPPHGHIGMVAVEPAVHSAGVGTTVMAALMELVRGAGVGPLLLECIDTLEGFYARLGFRAIDRFEEPGSEDVVVMRADV